MSRSIFRSSTGSSYVPFKSVIKTVRNQILLMLLKSLIKTVRSHIFGNAAAYRRVCGRAVQCQEVCRLCRVSEGPILLPTEAGMILYADVYDF
jgi:hypothetical protein